MKITVETSVRTIERVNAIIAHAIDELSKPEKKAHREFFDINDKDLKSLASFRKKCIKEMLDSVNS